MVADGTIYIGAGDGGFHAVAAEDGKRRWRFDTRGAIRNAAAVDGDTVYVGSMDQFVYALSRSDGRERWRSDTGAAIDAALVVHDGRVLAGNRGAGLLSLDAATGVDADRILEIEDQGIRPAFGGPRQFARTIGGHEQVGAAGHG